MCVYVCVGVCSFTSLLSLASNFCVISSDLEFMATKELTAKHVVLLWGGCPKQKKRPFDEFIFSFSTYRGFKAVSIAMMNLWPETSLSDLT